jgi:hypothetical protein
MDYCSGAGNDLVEEWYSKLLEEAQADFDTTLKNLSIAEGWRGMKEFKMLGRGIGEVRFKSGNVQYRPMGSFEGERIFALLVGSTKKQNIYSPPDAFDLALKRRKLYKQGEGRLRERII